MTQLSERRSADRREMADRVQHLVSQWGFQCRRREGGDYPGPRCILLEIATRHGLCLSVDFDGSSCQPDTYVVCWFMGYKQNARLSTNFDFGACTVNRFHFQKLTAVAQGFDALLDHLSTQFAKIADGSALQPESLGPDNVEVAAQDGMPQP